jgi:hypothetical protein
MAFSPFLRPLRASFFDPILSLVFTYVKHIKKYICASDCSILICEQKMKSQRFPQKAGLFSLLFLFSLLLKLPGRFHSGGPVV